jgi:hypothetical protein
MALHAVTTDSSGKVIRPPFSWSYSRLKNFETCPHRYNQIDVTKQVKEPDSTELRDGFAVHDALAKRINHAKPLPPNMPFEHWIEYVMYGVDRTKCATFGAERKLAITERFTPCDYFDKINAPWLRTVADVLKVEDDYAHIVDWKTGKVKPDLEQLIEIATCVMVHYPQVMRIKGELVWLAANTKTTMDCTVDQIAEFWPGIMPRIEKLRRAHETNEFPATRNGLCRMWCPVVSCEHCGQ